MAIYAYYDNLSARKRAIYRRSDELDYVQIPEVVKLIPFVNRLESSLLAEDKQVIQKTLQNISDELVLQFNIPVVRIKVLAVRPSNNWGELHGLYQPSEKNIQACISLWMRTAKYKKIVAYRTFLRTYLHELCHHLDYVLFGLEDSLHTEGFFKRESALFKQLLAR